MSPYANKTYVCFDADNDINFYRLMRAWKKRDGASFEFYDAHDLTNIMSWSSEDSIKTSLRERMKNSKLFIVLVGDHTKNLYRFVRWEIEEAISRNLPIIVVNLNGKRSKDSNLCPPILRDTLAVHVSYNQKIIEFAMADWPTSHIEYSREGKDESYYYLESVYSELGL